MLKINKERRGIIKVLDYYSFEYRVSSIEY